MVNNTFFNILEEVSRSIMREDTVSFSPIFVDPANEEVAQELGIDSNQF